MHDHYSIGELCEAFDVSRNGYHAWATRAPSARDRDAAQLLPLIAAAHTAAASHSSQRVNLLGDGAAFCEGNIIRR